MVIVDENQAADLTLKPLRAGDAAAVAHINANGGLGGSGHPIQLTFCSTNLSQSGADQCAHEAATDPSIKAVVGSIASEDISTGLSAASLAEVDAEPDAASAWSSPTSFPTNSGSLLLGGFAALALNGLHAKRISELWLGVPAAQATIALINGVLASWKAAPLVHAVSIPVGASDVSSEVAAASQGTDAIVYGGDPVQMQQVATAQHDLGTSVPIITSSSYWTAASLKSNESILRGYNSANFYPTNDVSLPGNTQFIEAMNAAGQQGYESSEQAKSGWVAFDLFNTATRGMTTFTRESIVTALNKVSNFDAGGLIPPISFKSPGPLATFPRLHNLDYFWAKIDNGGFVAGPVGHLQPMYGP